VRVSAGEDELPSLSFWPQYMQNIGCESAETDDSERRQRGQVTTIGATARGEIEETLSVPRPKPQASLWLQFARVQRDTDPRRRPRGRWL
jgi:hypothetical protein